jgi:hypothetical protein
MSGDLNTPSTGEAKMPQNPADVTNPGVVNVVTQGDGLLSVDQTVKVGPSTNPGPLVAGLTSKPGLGPVASRQTVQVGPSTNSGPLEQAGSYAPGLGKDSPDQPVTVTPPMTAQRSVQGGTDSPTSKNCINTTANNVAGQVYGTGTPRNVFV